MTLAPHQRRGIMLNHEGQILTLAGGGDLGTASDYARCVVDGAMNAIIRMDGAEKASAFAFGLADRVAGGLREPTAIFPASAALPPLVPDDATEELLDALGDALAETPAPPQSKSGIPPWVCHCAIIIALCVGFVAGRGLLS